MGASASMSPAFFCHGCGARATALTSEGVCARCGSQQVVPTECPADLLPPAPVVASRSSGESEAEEGANSAETDAVTRDVLSQADVALRRATASLNNVLYPNQAQPVCKAFLEALEVTEFDPTEVDLADECTICQCGYEPKDQCTTLPCGHTFHHVCILGWFDRRNSCPVCREPYETSQAAYWRQQGNTEEALQAELLHIQQRRDALQGALTELRRLEQVHRLLRIFAHVSDMVDDIADGAANAAEGGEQQTHTAESETLTESLGGNTTLVREAAASVSDAPAASVASVQPVVLPSPSLIASPSPSVTASIPAPGAVPGRIVDVSTLPPRPSTGTRIIARLPRPRCPSTASASSRAILTPSATPSSTRSLTPSGSPMTTAVIKRIS